MRRSVERVLKISSLSEFRERKITFAYAKKKKKDGWVQRWINENSANRKKTIINIDDIHMNLHVHTHVYVNAHTQMDAYTMPNSLCKIYIQNNIKYIQI